jgi:predicted DNA-binding protein YlxM (UPF0122 family)
MMVTNEEWSEEFPTIPADLLTDKQREVVYWKHVSDMRFTEIAQLTGRHREAVVRSHRDAVRRIKRFMGFRDFLDRI